MRGMPWCTGKINVAASSNRCEGRALRLRVVSWPVSPRTGRRGGLGLFAVVVVVLSAQSAVLASSSAAPDWSKQAPATSPSDRLWCVDGLRRGLWHCGPVRRLQPARARLVTPGRGTAPLGPSRSQATHPPARDQAAIAYDAATGTVVLFGGFGRLGPPSGDTWTWNGASWSKQVPVTRPPVLGRPSMAYDAASRTAVLFGGINSKGACTTWHLDLGRLYLDQAGPGDQPARPGSRIDGLRRGHRHRRSCSAVPAPHGPPSATPGPGTALPGPGRPPATSPPARQLALQWLTTQAAGTAVLFGGERRTADAPQVTPGPGTARLGPSRPP